MSSARRQTRAHDRKQSGSRTSGVQPAVDCLVLIVDDFDDNREMYAEYLRERGICVAEARDGYEAIRKTIDLSPDLVVMDLSLPGLDGWEATRRLRADPRTAQVPVVAVTGYALGTQADRARAAGCDDVLTKPLLPEELLRWIVSTVGPKL